VIFVTVGTEQYPFNRLLDWIEHARTRDGLVEPIVVQHGACTNRIGGAEHHKTLSQEVFAETVERARVVISHCGEGSFLQLRSCTTPFLLVPRRHGLGEHLDDHQWELARALKEMGVPVGLIPKDIRRFLAEPVPYRPAPLEEKGSLIESLIARYEIPEGRQDNPSPSTRVVSRR
jgi:UDP-N-acetylglucosamine transferase subunit ALG13